MKRNLFKMIVGVLVVVFSCLLVINYHFREKTYKKIEREFKEYLGGKEYSLEEYVKKCYNFIGDRYRWVPSGPLMLPWRNLFYRNVWNLKKVSLACHIQNALFQRLLSKKMNRKDFRTCYIAHPRKRIFIHFYSKVKLHGQWVNVDVYEKDRGIPFGMNVREALV